MKSESFYLRLLSTFCLILVILIIPSLCGAEIIIVKETGEYIMGDNDTYTEAKKLALQDAKHLVLEKVGTYCQP